MRWLNTLTAKNTAKSTAGAVTSIATKKVAQSGKHLPPTLRRWCMGSGYILAETSGAALRVALSSPLKVVGISLLKNTARIAAQGWTVVLKYGKFDGNPILM